jgi:GAF domain-containing protein
VVGTGSVHGSGRHALSEHADPVLRDLTDLAELGSVVGPALAPFSAAERLQDLVDAARQVFAAGACSIALLDEQEQNLVFEAASGRGADLVRGTVIPIGSGLAGWVVSSGQTLEISQVADDPRFARDIAEQTGYVPRTLLAAPLETRDGTVGVVEVLDRGTGDDAGERDLVILALFARLAAETVVSARLFTQMGSLLLGSLASHASDGLAEALGRAAEQAGTDPDLADLASLLARLQATGPRERRLAVDVLTRVLSYAESAPPS